LEYTGVFAMLIDGSTIGWTPSTVQISGRHIIQMKLKLLKTVLEEEGTTGRIQLGVAPGCSAQVIVPACSVPVAWAGTDPIAPGGVTAPLALVPELLWLLLLLQAASAVMLATATAIPPIALLRNLIIGPPSSHCSRLLSVLGSSACRPSEVVSPVIRYAPSPGTGSQCPRTDYGPFPPAHPCRLIASRPVSYRCY
jgi:hypothetical protein